MPNHDKWSHPWTVHTSRLLMFDTSIKKFHETSSWCLNAGKLKNRAHLLWRKIGTQFHSAKFLNWGDHVNSVPDFAARHPPSPPPPPPHPSDILLHCYGRGTCRFLSDHLWSLAGKLFSVLVRSTRTTFTTTVFRCFHILLEKGCYQSVSWAGLSTCIHIPSIFQKRSMDYILPWLWVQLRVTSWIVMTAPETVKTTEQVSRLITDNVIADNMGQSSLRPLWSTCDSRATNYAKALSPSLREEWVTLRETLF